jgi:geranylgeranyl reductase family protein
VKTKHDIVVIGGGPCGSYAAYTAAKLGSKVAVCEEHERIGIPNHCAGHLNISSLIRLGIPIPQNIIENEINGAIFHSPSNKEFVLRRQKPITYVVDRERFDKHLFNLAKKAGVQYYFKSRVKSLFFNSGYVKGVTIKGEKGLEANVVIDAEGCSSAILKKTDLIGLNASMIMRGIQADIDRIESIEKNMVEVFFGRNVAPNFFAWIIPRKDGSAKVGLATSKGNPLVYLQRFMKKHPVVSNKLKKSKVTDINLHPIPLAGPIPKTYSNGFLVVGDAASQVKSTTGGGVIFGLTCANLAGEIAHEAVKNNNFSETFLSSYQHQWKRLVGFDLIAMLQMRRMLNSLSDRKIDQIITWCNRLGIDDVLQKVGDLDFQGRSLIPMIKYPSTIAIISYFIFSWLTSSKTQ